MPAALIEPVEMIRRLIAFDTTSRNSNLDLIRWVADYLDGFGIRPVLVHDETGAKANLFATLGPDADGGIVLSGHTDVVPVDGQDWSSDPWTLIERDGRLYGRGSADMKSFCALVLAKVPALIAAARERPFHIALSYDEEVGCLGIHGLFRHLRATGRRPRVVIIGEPTRMAVVNAHKGSTSVRTLVTGLASHSARSHQGVNAIAHTAELIAFLGRLGEELRETRHDPRFEPPYSTLSATMIQGGTAGNIIPAECALVWDIRSLPGTDPEALVARFTAFAEAEVLPRMRALSERTGITTRIAAHVRALE